jgi:hypothetical protein
MAHLGDWLIDTLAAAGLLTMVTTGYVLRFTLPPARNHTHELWGLSRYDWGGIHSWASLGLLLVLIIHLVLHWVKFRRDCVTQGRAVFNRPGA